MHISNVYERNNNCSHHEMHISSLQLWQTSLQFGVDVAQGDRAEVVMVNVCYLLFHYHYHYYFSYSVT